LKIKTHQPQRTKLEITKKKWRSQKKKIIQKRFTFMSVPKLAKIGTKQANSLPDTDGFSIMDHS